jgi:NTE family protein
MPDTSAKLPRPPRPRPNFECIALVLQGGGALGAYQAGVYQALAEADLQPDWVAGISIGAINAAIIAGNPIETRVERLREFWELVTSHDGRWHDVARGFSGASGDGAAANAFHPLKWAGDFAAFFKGDFARSLANQMSANRALFWGVPGFFTPRQMTPWLWPDGSLEATSYYNTALLQSTLERLIDFDRINGDTTRLSVGAVNVRTGNFTYFDNTSRKIEARHVMGSGALPPGFPAVEIDGEHYWDGGLVSNTPLRWVVEAHPPQDTLVFQVDLWCSRGEFPRNMTHVATRQKEIQYSSRTRAASDRFKELQRLRNAVARLLEKLPPELASSQEISDLRHFSERKVWNLIQLIYRSKEYEGDSKDYEFSRQSMEDHWRAGYHDTIRTLRHPEVLQRPCNLDGVFTFDIAEHGRE